MPKPEWTWVRDKRTGHQYAVAVVNPEHHQPLKNDPLGADGKPKHPKPRVALTRPEKQPKPDVAPEGTDKAAKAESKEKSNDR